MAANKDKKISERKKKCGTDYFRCKNASLHRFHPSIDWCVGLNSSTKAAVLEVDRFVNARTAKMSGYHYV